MTCSTLLAHFRKSTCYVLDLCLDPLFKSYSSSIDMELYQVNYGRENQEYSSITADHFVYRTLFCPSFTKQERSK